MVLVSILGDFHSSIFPLFYEFKDSITNHIVVYDDAFAKLQESKKVINSLQKFGASRGLAIDTQGYKLDEDSYESIDALAQKLKELALKHEVYVNTTDGLSNITVLLSLKTLEYGVKILSYDMHANTYNITTDKAVVKKPITKQMSIQEHFMLKGLHIRSVADKEFAHKNAPLIRELFENYQKEFKALKIDVTRGVLKEDKYPRALQLVKQMGLDFSVAKEITGGLFEWYVYLLVKELGADDVEVGLVVEEEFTQGATVVNEFDILVMKNNHLHMIECKFTAKVNLQELVYKYANLLDFIDDDGKMIIVTERPEYKRNLYNTSATGLESYRRAFLNKIIIRNVIINNRAAFVEDVKTYFSLG